jgi:hypothetical protein
MKARSSSGRWGLGWFILGAALAGCGGPLHFTPKGTPKAPGADAAIVAKVDEKASVTHLNITTEHLAPPDRLKSGGTTFVVWARKDDDAPWSRVGALTYDPEARKGQLVESSVPQTEFDLIISIESEADPESPSSDVVFTQRVED